MQRTIWGLNWELSLEPRAAVFAGACFTNCPPGNSFSVTFLSPPLVRAPHPLSSHLQLHCMVCLMFLPVISPRHLAAHFHPTEHQELQTLRQWSQISMNSKHRALNLLLVSYFAPLRKKWQWAHKDSQANSEWHCHIHRNQSAERPEAFQAWVTCENLKPGIQLQEEFFCFPVTIALGVCLNTCLVQQNPAFDGLPVALLLHQGFPGQHNQLGSIFNPSVKTFSIRTARRKVNQWAPNFINQWSFPWVYSHPIDKC